jgi:hypothetical protein
MENAELLPWHAVMLTLIEIFKYMQLPTYKNAHMGENDTITLKGRGVRKRACVL